MKKPLSIRKMLLIAFLLAGLLPTLLVSILSFYQARIALRTEIKHDLQTTSEAVAEHIDQILFERIQNVRSWSQLAIMQEIHIGDIDKRLSIFLKETAKSYAGQYMSIDVVDLQSKIVASSDARHIFLPLKTPPLWMSFRQNEEPVTIYRLESNQLVISAPIISHVTRQTIGLLVATFNWQVIIDLLNHASQNNIELALLDAQSHTIAKSNNWSDQRHSLHTQTKLASNLPFSDWQVTIKKNHAIAVAPVHKLGSIFLILLATISVFSLLLVRPIGQNISRPLEALTRYVQTFRRIDSISPTPSGPSEVQALHVAFNQMAADLQASEQQLTRAAKLAVVGEMAAAMSHEVRTPLGILRSSADLLKRESRLSSDGKEVVGFIISETERLNKLVSALIDSARPRQPNKIPLDMYAHLQHILGLLQKQATDRHISLTLEPTTPVTVWADQDQMTQVLLNLVMNAIQILPAGGQVCLTLHSDGQSAFLTVADDGPGVAEAQQSHLFEAFFTQRAGGVGLGLAVVKQIIEAHGGRIFYSTSLWNGAQFNITLPLMAE